MPPYWYYNPKELPTNPNGTPNVKVGRRAAQAMSVIGGGIAYIPHPLARIIGTGLSVPDMLYDVKDVVSAVKNKDNVTNSTLELISDYPVALANVTNTQTFRRLGFPSAFAMVLGKTAGVVDDFIPPIGIAIDAYGAITGRSALDDVYNYLYGNKNKNKNKNNTTVGDTR